MRFRCEFIYNCALCVQLYSEKPRANEHAGERWTQSRANLLAAAAED